MTVFRTQLLLSVLLLVGCSMPGRVAPSAGQRVKAQASAAVDTATGKKADEAPDTAQEGTSIYPVHAGLPQWMGGNGMLYVRPAGLSGGLSDSPFDYWVAKITVLAVWLTVISVIGLIAAAVLCYFRFPLWDELAIISAGIGGFSLAIVLLVDMLVKIWPWMIALAIVAVVGYIAYLLLTKTKLLKTCKELYQTGDKMKRFTQWESEEKRQILTIQSDPTIALVDKFEREDAARKKRATPPAGTAV